LPWLTGYSAAPEPEERATAKLAGVTIQITADRWTGQPPELTDVIPLEAVLEID
jgi:hypothetical protein